MSTLRWPFSNHTSHRPCGRPLRYPPSRRFWPLGYQSTILPSSMRVSISSMGAGDSWMRCMGCVQASRPEGPLAPAPGVSAGRERGSGVTGSPHRGDGPLLGGDRLRHLGAAVHVARRLQIAKVDLVDLALDVLLLGEGVLLHWISPVIAVDCR